MISPYKTLLKYKHNAIRFRLKSRSTGYLKILSIEEIYARYGLSISDLNNIMSIEDHQIRIPVMMFPWDGW